METQLVFLSGYRSWLAVAPGQWSQTLIKAEWRLPPCVCLLLLVSNQRWKEVATSGHAGKPKMDCFFSSREPVNKLYVDFFDLNLCLWGYFVVVCWGRRAVTKIVTFLFLLFYKQFIGDILHSQMWFLWNSLNATDHASFSWTRPKHSSVPPEPPASACRGAQARRRGPASGLM